MYLGKFDWAKCLGHTGDRNYVKEILHNSVCVQSVCSVCVVARYAQ